MKGKKINNPLVLVAPMDWGLGHATRCIPIIRALLAENCRVMLAASGQGKLLLQGEFPQLTCINAKGYNIKYGQSGNAVLISMLAQLPKIITTVYREHRWLKKIIKEYAVDVVISDNRMGMFNKDVYSVYITHQLQIQTGNDFTNRLARKAHYWFINKFNECWVPDTGGDHNLAGALSHPSYLPRVELKYIGPLSRFKTIVAEKIYDVAIILSGPEPQRTIFEQLVLAGIGDFAGRILLVRGCSGSVALNPEGCANLEVHDFMGAADLNRAIMQSGLIISRCGYSSVMDLVKLQKKAVLVPTPGQTEQEYLAGYLLAKKFFCCIRQKNFSFSYALKSAAEFSFRCVAIEDNEYIGPVKDLVSVSVLSQ
jgi:uncharacterized protein (TIGR00661 family)